MPTAFQFDAFQFDAFQIDVDPMVSARYARMMLELFPPGKVWRFVVSTLANFIQGCADELARVDARAVDLLNESDPSTAVELLPEYEAELRLTAAATTAERQARVVSRRVARQRVRPVDIQAALALLLGLVAADIVIIERTHAQAVAMGDDREIYSFSVYRNPTLPGTYFVASAQELLDSIAHSHTQGVVIESVDFLYDDPFSLYGRDLMA